MQFDTPSALLRQRLPALEQAAREEAAKTDSVAYATADNFVVTGFRPKDETYRQMTIMLKPTRYFVLKGTRGQADELLQAAPVDPYAPSQAELPLSLAVILHVIAGRGSNPQIILVKRSKNLGDNLGWYTGAVAGLSEDKDVETLATELRYNFLRAMVREFDEERLRTVGFSRHDLMGSIELLALIFNYQKLMYILTGYLIVDTPAERFMNAIPRAREGSPEAFIIPTIPPLRGGAMTPMNRQMLQAFCQYLVHPRYRWVPEAAISLILLLRRLYGEDEVDETFKRIRPENLL